MKGKNQFCHSKQKPLCTLFKRILCQARMDFNTSSKPTMTLMLTWPCLNKKLLIAKILKKYIIGDVALISTTDHYDTHPENGWLRLTSTLKNSTPNTAKVQDLLSHVKWLNVSPTLPTWVILDTIHSKMYRLDYWQNGVGTHIMVIVN